MAKELGWISLHRQLTNHYFWKEKRVFSKAEAWIDILLNVNHTDKDVLIKNTIYKVKRGDSINSLDTWASRWNWNKSKVRRFLSLLQQENMIVTKNETQTTRLTVCKYDSYQPTGNANETQVKRKRNANDTQTTPNNNVNNVNNENKVYRSFAHLTLSIEENDKLLKIYEQVKIDSILDSIENYKNNKNYKSLYLTCSNWLKREYPNYSKPKEVKKVTWSDFYNPK